MRKGKEEIWAVSVLLLFRCLVKRESDGDGLAFLRYMKFVRHLDEIHDALKFMCLQWAISGFGKEEYDVEKGVR